MALNLLLGTNNQGKAAEYRRLLAGLPLTLATPSEVGIAGEPEETGSTFEENALLKARFYAGASGLLSLADDSGIVVDALNGEPGVRSARYGGPQATDGDRNHLLLDRIRDVPWEKRAARFVAVVALAWPDGREETFHGSCQGYVAWEPRGRNGFGYDPIFYFPDFGKTFGEVSARRKDSVSHRGQAARKVVSRLRELVGTQR